MWTFLFLLVKPSGMRDLSSQIKDGTHASPPPPRARWQCGVLATGPPGKTVCRLLLEKHKISPQGISSLAEAALGLLVVTSSEGFLSPLKPLPFIFKRRREEAR